MLVRKPLLPTGLRSGHAGLTAILGYEMSFLLKNGVFPYFFGSFSYPNGYEKIGFFSLMYSCHLKLLGDDSFDIIIKVKI
jgi:hypothetical protein